MIPDLLDKETGKIDTLKYFRKTITDFDLEDIVIPVIGRSAIIGKVWKTPLSLIFIDGSHAYESVLNDYNIWAKNLIAGGYLLFHDIFSDPAKGGQAPYLVYQKAVASGLYEEMPMCESLGILIRKKIILRLASGPGPLTPFVGNISSEDNRVRRNHG